MGVLKKMTKLPTENDVEREILNIFKKLNSRPGDVLPRGKVLNDFIKIENKKGYRLDDLSKGLDLLLQKKYFVLTKSEGIKLTQSGFEKI